MISSLQNILRTRKDKLLTYFSNNTDTLPLEKQHQLYGAITEIDSINSILDEHRKKEVYQERNPDEIFLLRPIHNSKSFLASLLETIKDFF